MPHRANADLECLGLKQNGEVIEGGTEEETELEPYNDENIVPEVSTTLMKMKNDEGSNREHWTSKLYVSRQLDYEKYMDSLEWMENNNE